MATLKIDLPLALADDKQWHTVEASILDIAPHLSMLGAFAVHRQPKNWSWWPWGVSNIETGAIVAEGSTRFEAEALAISRLASKTPDDMAQAMRKARRRTRSYK